MQKYRDEVANDNWRERPGGSKLFHPPVPGCVKAEESQGGEWGSTHPIPVCRLARLEAAEKAVAEYLAELEAKLA